MILKISTHIYKFSQIPFWATVDPWKLSGKNPHQVQNLLDGKFFKGKTMQRIVDPLNGEPFIQNFLVEESEINSFVVSAKSTPKSGLHNPIKNVHRFLSIIRYNMYGDIFFKIAQQLRKPKVQEFFTKLLQRVMPKSTPQAIGQINVTRKFFENFSGDNARFLCKSFNVPGDYNGQTSSGYRWPYGNVAIISPFNFPIQIPALQLFGSLLPGNRPTLKTANKMQFLRMALSLGMPATDVNFLSCSHNAIEKLIRQAQFRVIQFTGSSQVSQRLSQLTRGKLKVEDAGFNWKILGPDVGDIEYVAYICDQDAYAASGQKCSAQSVLFVHQNWYKAGIISNIKKLASRRKLSDLTIGPVITWNNNQIQNHVDSIMKIKNSKLQFGGKQLNKHTIPQCYGSYQPTCISMPFESFQSNFNLCTTELFGPFQIAVFYNDKDIDLLINSLDRMSHHLTAGVVSNNILFLDKILGNTVNGVTYCGRRARTTGAPQNHWFGPAGDPRGAGIGTAQAIKLVWTCHRQIIRDYGPIVSNWKLPDAS